MVQAGAENVPECLKGACVEWLRGWSPDLRLSQPGCSSVAVPAWPRYKESHEKGRTASPQQLIERTGKFPFREILSLNKDGLGNFCEEMLYGI